MAEVLGVTLEAVAAVTLRERDPRVALAAGILSDPSSHKRPLPTALEAIDHPRLKETRVLAAGAHLQCPWHEHSCLGWTEVWWSLQVPNIRCPLPPSHRPWREPSGSTTSPSVPSAMWPSAGQRGAGRGLNGCPGSSDSKTRPFPSSAHLRGGRDGS